MAYTHHPRLQRHVVLFLRLACLILLISGVAIAEWEPIGNLKPAGRK